MASGYGSLAKEAIVLLDKFSAGTQCVDDFVDEASKDLQHTADQYKMAPNYGSLAKEAIVLLDKFSTSRQCADDFMDEASKDLQNRDTVQRTFILDVVSGCIEHKKTLDKVIKIFYSLYGKCLSKNDRTQFVVVCFLVTFSLDELGLQRFSNIIKSLDAKSMHKFLTFFFTKLTTWIQEGWNNIYDAAFVEECMIAPLLRWRPEMDVLLDQLAVKISCANQVKKPPIKTTKPKEFALTKPKPRPLPLPELIPQQEKAKRVPNSTYRPPKEMEVIDEIKQKNHQKTEELLYEANMKQFRCANPKKSEHAEKVMFQIKENSDSKLKFSTVHSSGPPSSLRTNWPIKLNSTAVLRHRMQQDRLVEEELQKVERLVEGEYESSAFLQWQKEMQEKDLQEEQARINQRLQEGHLSHLEAVMTRKRLMESNQKTVQLQKEETSQLMRRYAEKRLQEEKEMRDLVQQVAEGHKISKAAKEKLQKLKQNIVKEVSKQKQELLRQALEEAQAELSRKFEIICEIRAIESLPHIRVRNFDGSETAGHRLLGEMSILELKERLAMLREAQQTELRKKREHITEDRQNKKQLLFEMAEANNLFMRAQARENAIRKEEKKSKLAAQQMAAQNFILACRKEREEKILALQRMEQNESKKAKVPEKTHTVRNTAAPKGINWEEMEKCLERHI